MRPIVAGGPDRDGSCCFGNELSVGEVGPKNVIFGGVVGATAAGRRAARRATNFSLAASLGCERAERASQQAKQAGDETLRDLGTRAPRSPRIIVQ